jgi:hypothetical protein
VYGPGLWVRIAVSMNLSYSPAKLISQLNRRASSAWVFKYCSRIIPETMFLVIMISLSVVSCGILPVRLSPGIFQNASVLV